LRELCLENSTTKRKARSNGTGQKEYTPVSLEENTERSKLVLQQSKLEHTDLGNARRLVLRHGSELHYCHCSKTWFCYDGMRWAPNSTGEIHRRAKETVLSIFDEMRPDDKEQVSQAIRDHARASQSEGRIAAMISLARSEPGIPILPEAFDANPWLLNVFNGTLDLRTGQLSPHRVEDLITNLVPVKFDPSACCPLWLSFLDRISAETFPTPFLQRVSGYALTGSTREQVFFLFYGAGANGKSTFLNVLLELLGEYALQTPTQTIMARRDNTIPNDVARLKGSRVVAAIESDDDSCLSEARVKQFTGEDRVAARFLFGEWFEFVPEFKLFLAVNQKPKIRGNDEAIWRTVNLIPLTETIPEPERDKDLGRKLRAELPGILNWALEGCLMWQKEGLNIPAEIREATAEYRAEMDVIADFLEACCLIDCTAEISKALLYSKYSGFSKTHGEKAISKRSFGTKVREHGFAERRGTGGARFWCGIRGKPVSLNPKDAVKG
jgi:putative DNA primase/helicase